MQRPFLVHAITPLHAGTGHSADLIDLPIARMKATNIPYVPGSSIKGVLRSLAAGLDSDLVSATFGPDTDHAGDHAGALVVGDARLLAMPVRSMIGTFAWVSSPLLLQLAARDLGEVRPLRPLPPFKSTERFARHAGHCCCRHNSNKIFLEDLDLDAIKDDSLAAWTQLLAERIYSDSPELFSERFVVVDDETMSFLLETATQVDARVRIDDKTHTVAKGALWLEESLPAESLLIGMLSAEHSRSSKPYQDKEILNAALPPDSRHIQLGGKASVGRGRCRLLAMNEVRP